MADYITSQASSQESYATTSGPSSQETYTTTSGPRSTELYYSTASEDSNDSTDLDSTADLFQELPAAVGEPMCGDRIQAECILCSDYMVTGTERALRAAALRMSVLAPEGKKLALTVRLHMPFTCRCPLVSTSCRRG
jgi:hypothetical protein